MTNYLIYNQAGEIVQTGSMLEEMFELQIDEEGNRRPIMAGNADPKTQYVQDAEVVARPTFAVAFSAMSAAADGSEEITLSGLPAGVAVSVAGPAAISGVTDGSDIVLTFVLPGRYMVRLKLFPYQDMEVTLNAV